MLKNDITKAIDGADNLPITVYVRRDYDADNEQELTWRQARAQFAKPLCELLDACLRWVLDVERLGWKVTLLRISMARTRPELLRLRIKTRTEEDGDAIYLGDVCLELDTMPKEGGPTYLCLTGTLQELEDDYIKALREAGEQP